MDRSIHGDSERVREFIAEGDDASLESLLATLHPADIADIVQQIEPNEQVAVLKRLPRPLAAEVLTEIDQYSGQALLLLLSDRDVVSLLGEMRSDDAVDIMSAMPPERSERVEALLPTEDREQIQELMEFDEETAGGIMEAECIAVREYSTISDAIRLVRASADEIENIQKVFIVDDGGVLVGHVRVLDLLLHSEDTPVRDVMKRSSVSVPVDMDQEEVAALFGKYDEFTLPVVDANNKLVGRITVDDIIDVMEEEASEDIVQIAGTNEEELGATSPFKVSRNRLPWLITGLVGQVVAALIVSQFQVSLQTYVVLVFFIPLIVGTAGAIGMQAAVVVVRELALGQIDLLRMGSRVSRELGVAIINWSVLGAILFITAVVWQRELGLAVLLTVALLIAIVVAAMVGSSMPLLLRRWKVDPAVAAGPFVTVSNDIIGLVVYLSLATLYLAHFR